MTLGRACTVVILACAFAPGCDWVFAITHVPDQPTEAGTDGMPDAAPPCPATDISVGQRHACAIIPGGEVYCWGGNEFGQVQPAGPNHVLTPTRVPLPAAADEVVVGKNTSCARLGGDVYCWGQNDTGNLGGGMNDTGSTVRKIPTIPKSAQVAVGGGHVCSLTASDGTVWCWGRSGRGQTGQSASNTCQGGPCTDPAPVPGIANAKALYAGHNETCVIDANDQAICWGRNADGELGIGTQTVTPTPPTIVQITPPVKSLDITGKSMCAIDGAQRVWCSGQGEYGQVGNGFFNSVSTPVQVFVTSPTQVQANAFGTCAITGDNALACWGSVDPGDGKPGTYATPHISPVHDLTKLAGHYYAYCGIANGGVLCWGNNNDGQLGRGSRGLVTVPQALAVPSPTAVAVGEEHGCAIGSDGVRCWGANAYGQVGDASLLAHKITPTLVTLPAIAKPSYVAAFDARTCVWGSGEGACWGRGFGGSLGVGLTNDDRTVPPTKLLRANIRNDALSIGLGSNHMCVIDDNMTVTCYGRNTEYQLGTGTQTNQPAGVTLAIAPVDQVVAGIAHTCVRKVANGGEVWCWGTNDHGALGTGDSGLRSTPSQVVGIGTVTKIGAGEQHTCALNGSTGQVFCWGLNGDGQVGNNSQTDRLAATEVVTGGATDLIVGARSTCAKVSGSWRCWGRNQTGQLATGSFNPVIAPTMIPAFADATTLATGNVSGCKISPSGLFCAGRLATLGTGDNSESFPKAPMLPGCQ